jgi:integrase
MASIHRDYLGRSPYWFACFRGADGRRLRKSTKTSDRKQALRIAVMWEKLAEQGRKGQLVAAQARRVVSEMVEAATGEVLTFHSVAGWLRDWAKGKEGAVSAATAARYRQIVEDFLAHLGATRAEAPLGSVSPRDISSMRDSLRKQGLSARGCNAIKETLNIPFAAAKQLGFIAFNPCGAVDSLKERDAAAGREAFTAEEVCKLLCAAKGDWYGAILAGWTTGLRLSDVASLTWSNVDIEARVIRVVARKTQTSLVLPMHDDLLSWLLDCPHGLGKAPLFPSLYGKQTGGKYGLSNQFASIVREAGITHRVTERHGRGRTTVSKSFHSLRHGLITSLANAGVPPDVRQKIAGHSSDKVHAVYSHHTTALLRTAVDSLPSVVERKEAV